MPRGSRRYLNQKPYCPECHTEILHITGPLELVKGVEKVPCRCGACGHTWKSENRGVLMLAMAGR